MGNIIRGTTDTTTGATTGATSGSTTGSTTGSTSGSTSGSTTGATSELEERTTTRTTTSRSSTRTTNFNTIVHAVPDNSYLDLPVANEVVICPSIIQNTNYQIISISEAENIVRVNIKKSLIACKRTLVRDIIYCYNFTTEEWNNSINFINNCTVDELQNGLLFIDASERLNRNTKNTHIIRKIINDKLLEKN